MTQIQHSKSVSVSMSESASTPMDVIFLRSGRRDSSGRLIDDGFDFRPPSESSIPIKDADLPFEDEYGREIIRCGRDVTLPFVIHCWGHHCLFEYVGQQKDDMFELREYNGRYLIYSIDPPFVPVIMGGKLRLLPLIKSGNEIAVAIPAKN